MEIADPGIGLVIVALGGLLIITGIGLAVTILLEKRWWEVITMAMLSMELPDFGLGGLQPVMQQTVQGMLKRVFIQIKFIALIGGGGISIIGIVIIFLGLGIWL